MSGLKSKNEPDEGNGSEEKDGVPRYSHPSQRLH